MSDPKKPVHNPTRRKVLEWSGMAALAGLTGRADAGQVETTLLPGATCRTTPGVANYLELMDALVTDGVANQVVRGRNLTTHGREGLCLEYGVPYQDPGDVGHAYANYSSRDHFNQFIRSLIDSSKRAMVGRTYSGTVEHRLPTGPWRMNDFFSFAHRLATDPEFCEVFHDVFERGTGDEQHAFLQQHLPGNPFNFWQAIKDLFGDPGDETLAASMNELVVAFQGTYEAA